MTREVERAPPLRARSALPRFIALRTLFLGPACAAGIGRDAPMRTQRTRKALVVAPFVRVDAMFCKFAHVTGYILIIIIKCI